MRRLLLATRDAHALYSRFGLTQLSDPGLFMALQRPAPDLYGQAL